MIHTERWKERGRSKETGEGIEEAREKWKERNTNKGWEAGVLKQMDQLHVRHKELN